MNRLLSALILLTGAVIGVAAFAYPFLLPALPTEEGLVDAPLLTMSVLVLCLLALLVEMQGQVVSAKRVAALGVMVALASALRFVEVAIPGPGGFSPIFVPVLLVGYVFGARSGFLMGALTLLVSAFVTGGVGPWLPYQMFVAAWMGFTAGCLPHPRRPGVEVALLVAVGFIWGLLYGAITNLYFWPFFVGAESQQWMPGSQVGTAVARYGAFYVATSLIWDVARGVGNGLLLAVVAGPAVRALARFRDRLQFTVESDPVFFMEEEAHERGL